ncbi:tricorn protease [Stackebrandtia albiflava]|uniref:Tricorn protease homolog n=1 Tax=Stackebrandtia albiflava TaxID=406432 RepID=A0A562VAB9_9ACTN|nr:S41 family peptidase [Stackebrandtia albiflava]TWJ14791.1 tricorn protease [Stackebrandtia albiflava]
MTDGYPRFPTIHHDTVVFVAEDDLWQVSADGGTAHRITNGLAAVAHPAVSPDGRRIAYVAEEDGAPDLFVRELAGGPAVRITHQAAAIGWVDWESDDALRYASNAEAPHGRDLSLWRVTPEGGLPERLPLGRALSWQTDPSGLSVISRGHPTRSAAYQKRYRGGTAGQLWIDAEGNGEYRLMTSPHGFVENPQIIDGRVYFLSDHEGVGNVYSYLPDGTDLRRHTDHTDHYARGLGGDGTRLVYHCGGTLHVLDPAAEGSRALDISIPSSHTQRARRYVDAAEYLHTATLTPDGSQVTIETRAKLFTFPPFDGAVWQHGDPDARAYRLPTWLAGGRRLVAAASDEERSEVLVELSHDGSAPPRVIEVMGDRRPVSLTPSPTEAALAVVDHSGALLLLDLSGDDPVLSELDSSRFGDIADVTFSPDGRWLAYTRPIDRNDSGVSEENNELVVLELVTGEITLAAERVRVDEKPSFDPGGRYLYFIGHREFEVGYQHIDFGMTLMWGSRPYAVALRADVPAPFLGEPADDTSPEDFRIDTRDLAHRVVPFDLPPGRYTRVLGIAGKALVLSHPDKPLGSDAIFSRGTKGDGTLQSVDLVTGETERLADDVGDMWLSSDTSTLLCRSGDRLRVLKAGDKAEGDEPGRKSGLVDLDRVRVSVRPDLEWPQLFAEAWRLEREHFWLDDFGGNDWDDVYRRYAPLATRVRSRAEFSDLLWEMQGELGNSHAYEMFGDHRRGPAYRQGFLGVDYAVDPQTGGYRFARILAGDRWAPQRTSPLNRPGVDVREGDTLLAVDGLPVGPQASPGERLADLGGREVWLTVQTGSDSPRRVKVKALTDERALRYREWVEANRRLVHEASGGLLGYIHIPDMMTGGWSEFIRNILTEEARPGLVVDLRYNGGGHISSQVLDRLARPRSGFMVGRHSEPFRYPEGSQSSAMVALINESAGSDGDLGSHHFRSRGLGPLIGTRTWGGTVGINPRHFLADNTLVTQPEVAMHLDDVGYGLENHGVDPDIEVYFAPQDHAAGVDPQLRRGIEEALALVERHGDQRPRLSARPNLKPGTLPPR